MEKLGTGQNLKEHVERSEKHFPRPEQVENTGGGGVLLHNHVLADGSRLQKVVWKLPAVTIRHSLSFDLCLRKVSRGCLVNRLPARSFPNLSANEGIPAQATTAQAGLEKEF